MHSVAHTNTYICKCMWIHIYRLTGTYIQIYLYVFTCKYRLIQRFPDLNVAFNNKSKLFSHHSALGYSCCLPDPISPWCPPWPSCSSPPGHQEWKGSNNKDGDPKDWSIPQPADGNHRQGNRDGEWQTHDHHPKVNQVTHDWHPAH